MATVLTGSPTIVGTVGRGSTTRMIAAIAADAPQLASSACVLMLSAGTTRATAGAPSRTWSEVLSAVDPAATIVVPQADARLARAAALSGARVMTFGFDPGADVSGSALAAGSQGTEYDVRIAGEMHRVRLALLGEHLAENSLAALAVAVAAAVPARTAIGALEAIRSAGSGVMHRAAAPPGVLVIDDSAAMTAESVTAALKTLAMLGTEGLRTVAILGELDVPHADQHGVAEAAEIRREAHDRIGRIVVRLNIGQLVVVGQAARHIHNAAGLEGSWNGESVLVDTLAQAYDRVREELAPGDAVLVKSPGASGTTQALLIAETDAP